MYSYNCISHDHLWLYKYSYNCKYVSSICTLIIVSISILKITNLKSTFYEYKEMQDIMIKIYLMQRNLISFLRRTISFSFVWAKTFDRAKTFTRTFDRARTFTRTFDRGVVWRQNSDLKFCRRIFYYAAGKSGMCMNFWLCSWKKWWWIF